MSRDNAVGMATHCGLDDPGIESPGGEVQIFRTRPDRSLSPPSLLYNGYRVYFLGVQLPGRGVNHKNPSSAEVKIASSYTFTSHWNLWPVLE
jgi:hypothetical protein